MPNLRMKTGDAPADGSTGAEQAATPRLKTKTLTTLSVTVALALAGCGSSINGQAVGTQSGRAFVACFKSHVKIPTGFMVARDFTSWEAGKAGPDFKSMYGTTCGAPTKPLTTSERATAQVIVGQYAKALNQSQGVATPVAAPSATAPN